MSTTRALSVPAVALSAGLATLIALAACSAGGGGTVVQQSGNSSSGVDRSKAFAQMTAAEAESFCKWTTDLTRTRGEGPITCGDAGTVTFNADPQQCLATAARIKAAGCNSITVAQVENCMNDLVANPCERDNRCDLIGDLSQACGLD